MFTPNYNYSTFPFLSSENAFLKGVARVMDLYNTLDNKSNGVKESFYKDYKKLKNDWEIIGLDMLKAIYLNEQSTTTKPTSNRKW